MTFLMTRRQAGMRVYLCDSAQWMTGTCHAALQALFVATGTQGNLAAILALCGRGDEVLLGSESHVLHYEVRRCCIEIKCADLPDAGRRRICLVAMKGAACLAKSY